MTRLLLLLGLLYVLACAGLMFWESRMLYVPYAGPTQPEAAGLNGWSADRFTATDGATIPYWEHAARSANAPVLLYFHGNGGGLHAFVPALDWLGTQDVQLIAMEYRGFPGAPDRPSEKAIIADAVALFDHVSQRYPTRPIAIWGYSLGTGVATQLAAARTPAALVLEAPFSSAVDRAQQLFPLIPTRLLMRDQFLSREHIGQVKAPVLIMHGEADIILPIGLAEQLYARAPEPKKFLRYPGRGHYDLIDTDAYPKAIAFIDAALAR